MTKNRIEDREVIDCIGEKNQYWDQVLSFAERLLSSDNPSEIIADYVTKLTYSDFDLDSVDPLDALVSVAADWGVATSEEDEYYEELA